MANTKTFFNKLKNNIHMGELFSNKRTVSFYIILILTLSVLTFSHNLNLIHIETALIEQHEIETRSFEVYFDAKLVGNIRDKNDFNNVLNEVKESLQAKTNAEVAISSKIEFKSSHAEEIEISSHDEIVDKIKSNIKYGIIVYGIDVNGEVMGELKTFDEAKKLLDDIKAPYEAMMENSEIVSLDFAEDVKIVQVEVSEYDIDNYDELLKYLEKGTTEEKIHVVENGDNFWTISSKYNLSVDELVSANPTINPELIHPGDEISLIIPKPYIGVKTVEIANYQEKISFDTKYEYVSWLYNDEYTTKTSGEYGLKDVEAQITKENGIEVSNKIIKENITKQPVAKIIYNGTIAPPPKKGTGTFINPLPSAYISSRYGSRWGSFHYGLDLAARTGTPFKAADGGIVTKASWSGDYGYMIEIDHGGGFVTRYAHCSEMYVKVGEKVYQGKIIGAVGSTGFTTGPHVHFEVRKYGVTVNPEIYMGKTYR